MGCTHSNFDDNIRRQETDISKYMSDPTTYKKLSCDGKYSDAQIRGKLREHYWHADSYSKDSWINSSTTRNNGAYKNAPTHSTY